LANDAQPPDPRSPSTDEEIRAHTIGEPQLLSSRVVLTDYDPEWPSLFEREAATIRATLGLRALRIEHVGSTSVPGLIAKPVIDIVLAVADSGDEPAYVPPLEAAGYFLRIREADWHQHRLLCRRLQAPDASAKLHVFSSDCPEIARMLAFRDWLRCNAGDRELYARTKRALAQQEWNYMQNYADAKTAVVGEIMARAVGPSAPEL